MTEWYIQIAVNGLGAGMLYVLTALGFTMTYSIMRVVNFAHGHLYMLGALFTYSIIANLGMHFFAGLLISMVLVGLVGIVLERLIFSPLMANHEASVVAAVGSGIFIMGLAEAITGGEVRGVESPWGGAFEIGGVVIGGDRLLVLCFAIVSVSLFYLFINYTKFGRATRAAVGDLEIAGTFGINAKWVYIINFALSSALAGLAGSLISPIVGAVPTMAFPALLKSFVVVVLGGIGSIPGAVIGGLLLGFFDSTVTTLLSAQIAEMGSFVGILILLIFRPTGLLGRRQ